LIFLSHSIKFKRFSYVKMQKFIVIRSITLKLNFEVISWVHMIFSSPNFSLLTIFVIRLLNIVSLLSERFILKLETGIPYRKIFGTGRYLKAGEKDLAYTKLNLVKQRIGCSCLGIATAVAHPGKILAYSTSPMSTLDTLKAIIPFDFREIHLAI